LIGQWKKYSECVVPVGTFGRHLSLVTIRLALFAVKRKPEISSNKHRVFWMIHVDIFLLRYFRYVYLVLIEKNMWSKRWKHCSYCTHRDPFCCSLERTMLFFDVSLPMLSNGLATLSFDSNRYDISHYASINITYIDATSHFYFEYIQT
jgi:hypothetical protein